MSEASGTEQAPPLILDAGVLTALARSDAGVTGLLMDYDASGQPLIIPPIAAIAALTDLHSEDAVRALRGLEQLENVTTAGLASIKEASAVAWVIAHTDTGLADANTAALALTEAGRILTLDAGKWRQHAGDPELPLTVVEIADPGE